MVEITNYQKSTFVTILSGYGGKERRFDSLSKSRSHLHRLKISKMVEDKQIRNQTTTNKVS